MWTSYDLDTFLLTGYPHVERQATQYFCTYPQY